MPTSPGGTSSCIRADNCPSATFAKRDPLVPLWWNAYCYNTLRSFMSSFTDMDFLDDREREALHVIYTELQRGHTWFGDMECPHADQLLALGLAHARFHAAGVALRRQASYARSK